MRASSVIALGAWAACGTLSACSRVAGPGAEDLIDQALERGVDYVNASGDAEKRVILEANGAGVALIDLASDGDLDLVFSQGLSSFDELASGRGADLEVFENDGRGVFARRPGPGLAGWWTGLAVGDVDQDGDDDLVAGGFGALELLLQDQDGRLVRRAESGLAPPPARRWFAGRDVQSTQVPEWTTSVALFDADRDGRLDLYACRYLDLDPRHPPRGALGKAPLSVPCEWKGYEVFCGPHGLEPQLGRIFRGRGDGTFEDATERWLPHASTGYGMAVLPFDADLDGDTDLFVANDSSPNFLYVNDGGLDGACTFTDHGYEAGVALSADGAAQAGMGAASGDVDRDGRIDFAVTNFSDEPTELFLGAASGFARATYRAGLASESRQLLSWSVHLADFDGDGWLELFTSNGHVYPQADREHTGTSYAQPPALWRLGSPLQVRAWTPSSESSILRVGLGGRGSAVGDLDLDGTPDLVLVRMDAPAVVGMNGSGRAHHRLAIRCLGPEVATTKLPRTPRDGHGTRVVVVIAAPAGEHGLYGEAQTAVGYQSASSPWLHFGLDASPAFEKILIHWPSGAREEIPGGAADRRITVREGQGVVHEEAFRR